MGTLKTFSISWSCQGGTANLIYVLRLSPCSEYINTKCGDGYFFFVTFTASLFCLVKLHYKIRRGTVAWFWPYIFLVSLIFLWFSRWQLLISVYKELATLSLKTNACENNNNNNKICNQPEVLTHIRQRRNSVIYWLDRPGLRQKPHQWCRVEILAFPKVPNSTSYRHQQKTWEKSVPMLLQ